MSIWKNGKDVPYMRGSDRLTHEKVQYAIGNMSYTGLQTAAASFLLLAQSNGLSPAEMMAILEVDNKPHPVKYTPELDLQG